MLIYSYWILATEKSGFEEICFLHICLFDCILRCELCSRASLKLNYDSLPSICDFGLLCSLYDQLFKPSKLPANADFHLFKSGVEPKWEDPECANGGKWTVTSSRKANLDNMWLETVWKL